MFNPQYRVTPHLISCFEAIASRTALIQHAGIKISLRAGLENEAVNRSVHSSTWIEGNTLSLAQVAALSARQDVIAEDRQKIEVENCLNALRWLIKNRGQTLTEPKLLKTHALMMKGLLPPARCGKYRNIQNYIINARNQIIYTPPAPAKIKRRMADLFVWLSRFAGHHPLVRAAIFHHEFAAIHPFTDGNGRTARAALQGLLFEKGYEPLYTLGLDDFFAADRPRYYDMIQQTHDLDGDYTYWVEYVAEGLADVLEKVSVRIKQAERSRKSKGPALTPKQEELLSLLAARGAIGSSEICERMQINRSRVNQLIAPMVKAGIVIKRGVARSVQYHLA